MNEHRLARAADWFDQQDSLSSKQKKEFERWLDLPENAVAYHKISQAMHSSELAAAMGTEVKNAKSPLKKRSQNKPSPYIISLNQFTPSSVAASLACIAIFMSFFVFLLRTPEEPPTFIATPQAIYQQQIQAPVGSRTSQVLQDGTQVHLNADSQLQVQQSSTSRYARMEKGQIYFDVAKDKKRPFVIDVGDTQIRVLGTAFDVDHSNASTLITVYQGRVQIKAAEVLVLTKGEQVLVENGQPRKLEAKQLPMLPPWRSGWLEVDQRPLQEVVEHMQRYIEKPVEIASQELLNLKISGRFPLDQSLQSLTLIANAQQFSLTHDDHKITLSY
ncbi:MAG: FecR domain-containing protein [Aliiglaciecola sp.]|uniref:FecR family protein n=1 Tax=Aliiglaciecola sp. TaxID=1872441 RepID=UPI003296F781